MAALLSWLVIGVGDITTRRVIPAILAEPRSRLAGIVTRTLEKAQRFQVTGWTNLDEALRRSEADAVYVATPVALHGPQAIDCLKAGKHVLCEKPMAMSFSEALEMQRVAEAAKRRLGVAYYRRTYPKVARARELIAAGAIGRPVLAEASSHGWFDGRNTSRSWLVQPGMAGGGPLYDVASHRIDLMNYLLGRPVEAVGQVSNAIHPIAVEDNATVLIAFARGARGVVDVRWHSKVDRDEFRIRGTEGELDLSPLNGADLKSPRVTESLPNHANLHFPCIANFVDAVLDGSELLSSGASALWTDWVTQQVMDGVQNRARSRPASLP